MNRGVVLKMLVLEICLVRVKGVRIPVAGRTGEELMLALALCDRSTNILFFTMFHVHFPTYFSL